MLSGYTLTRNCHALDYCFELTIASLLPVCDEVVVCDAESNDGTREQLDNWAAAEPKLRIVTYPWPNPVRDITWFTTWINFARGHLRHPMQLQLDADEVLCPLAHDTIRRAAAAGECRWLHRLNFWRDPQHLAPHGRVCGEQVVRLAPAHLWMPSDEPHPEGEPEIRVRAGWPPNAARDLRIFHYGFLRRQPAFFAKVRAVNGAFFGSYDDRLVQAEAKGTAWQDECPFDLPLLDYREPHPELAHPWLRARGYQV